jgi:hypothetical protein
MGRTTADVKRSEISLAVSLMSLGQKVKLHFRARGVPDGLRLAPLRLARKVAGSAYRRSVHPLLNDLYAMSPHVFQTPEEILMRFTDATESALVGLRAEWGVLRTTLDQRSGVRQLKYPTFYAVTSDSSFLLYALVRLRRPASILETGVANGHSTYFLLHALRANGTGRLYSVDISSDVGVLLDQQSAKAGHFCSSRTAKNASSLEPLSNGRVRWISSCTTPTTRIGGKCSNIGARGQCFRPAVCFFPTTSTTRSRSWISARSTNSSRHCWSISPRFSVFSKRPNSSTKRRGRHCRAGSRNGFSPHEVAFLPLFAGSRSSWSRYERLCPKPRSGAN